MNSDTILEDVYFLLTQRPTEAVHFSPSGSSNWLAALPPYRCTRNTAYFQGTGENPPHKPLPIQLASDQGKGRPESENSA
jgi:hypothetical protein